MKYKGTLLATRYFWLYFIFLNNVSKDTLYTFVYIVHTSTWFHFHWCQLRIYHCSAFCSWTKKAIEPCVETWLSMGYSTVASLPRWSRLLKAIQMRRRRHRWYRRWMPMGCSIGWLWLIEFGHFPIFSLWIWSWVILLALSYYIYSWVISSYSLKLMHERKVPGVWRLRYQTLERTWIFNLLQDALRRVADALQLNQHGTHEELHNSLNSAQTLCPNQ